LTEDAVSASGTPHEYPLLGKLIGRMKALSNRIAALAELRRIDDRQLDEIAHEFGMSKSDLYALCTSKAPTGELLRQRLSEFGLTEESLAKQHPDVLQDLQRVCGNCATTSRCADDFVRCRPGRRDDYCPNSCTLYALRQEGLARQG
jgi:uncharacterized protein YjiS (DUF1127 family)